ncbi:hypothetical protein [Deinococcus aestuarii]|uniref:hypothetical protein n=1 Tax=Deinococcus aestuarii TaxID=2774531 RepID=UPI001C0C4E10|nr:hypothetical protein [Deinococcus aestuarii]
MVDTLAKSRGAVRVGILGSVLAVAELGMVTWMGRRITRPLNWTAPGCTGPALVLVLVMELGFGPLNVMVGTLFDPAEVAGVLDPTTVRRQDAGSDVIRAHLSPLHPSLARPDQNFFDIPE